jgi:aryl-alcohol dehydrogenase-like predicted oxidoreductase
MAVAKRELGRTGLQVTTLGYGAMELRGAPRARDITEAQAETILNKVLDAGINYIDTSVDYGLSEERIGRYISHRRAEYYWPANAVVWSARPRLRAASGGNTSSLATTSWRGSNRVL